MILSDLSIPGNEGMFHLHIEEESIKNICEDRTRVEKGCGGSNLSFPGATVYPGLINSHDHLDFNSFPQLGNRIYVNYSEWGKDIHEKNRERIDSVLNIPVDLRIRWGIYKNLLNGFTTVVNHGKRLAVDEELISVFQDAHPLHSPAFEKNWRWKLNDPLRDGRSVVIHIGEGTDRMAKTEVARVIRWNLWRRRLVAIHGVAMEPGQAVSFAGLVWCPASNYFLFGRTAEIDRLKKSTRLVFGTDSTLTAGWNAWAHFRQATGSRMVNGEELMTLLTSNPAKLWNFHDRGKIATGMRADLLITRNKPGEEDFSDLNPGDILLVMHKGQIRLLDNAMIGQVEPAVLKGFSQVVIDGYMKWVQGDLPELVKRIRSYDPGAMIPFDCP